MPKSRLYRKLPPTSTPFATVTIGNKIYDDKKIISIKINYGKRGNSLIAEIPTATIELSGKIPLAYNENVEISFNLPGITNRFLGRVGAQSINDISNKKHISTIIATSHTIRLFRDESKFDAYNTVHTLAHAIGFMYDRATINKVPGGAGYVSSAMWDKDYFRVGEYTSKDVLQIFEQLGIAVVHRRAGSCYYAHPKDRIKEMERALSTAYPLQRSEALSPATHEQPTSYIDARPRLIYYALGDDTPQYVDIFTKYFPDVEIPRLTKDTEIRDFVYTTDSWKYPARINLMQNAVKKWSTPSITVDMLLLKNGNSYNKKMFTQLANLEEGGFIVFSGDWDKELRGAKVVQGITETLNAQGWSIEFSLADPAAVIGYSEIYDPMPAPRELTWAQQTGTWGNQTKKWGEY